MAITFRTAVRGVAPSSGNNPFDITVPSGAAQDDILVLTVYAYKSGGTANIATPTGWTLAGTWQANNGSDFDEIRVFWIRRGASNPSLSVSREFSEFAQWSCDAIVGCRTTGNPYSAQTTTTVGVRANPDPGSVATTNGETVYTAVGTAAGNTTAFTAPTNHTIRQAGSAGDNCASSSRAITSGSSEDPGAYGGAPGSGTCGELTWSLVAADATATSTLTVEQASYAFTPQGVATKTAFGQTSGQASYSFTPQGVTTSRTAANVIATAQASYAFTPQNIATIKAATYFTTISQASYSFTPQNVTTQAGRISAAGQASYAFTPQNIATKSTFVHGSGQASYAFTPQNVSTSLIRSFITTAGVGSYSFSPQDAMTRQSVIIEPVGQASYAFTPQDIVTSTVKAYVMAAGQAGYTLTPRDILTVAFLSRILAVGCALYSFTPYGVVIPGEVAPGNPVRRRNNRALAARLWRDKQELARKLFEGLL